MRPVLEQASLKEPRIESWALIHEDKHMLEVLNVKEINRRIIDPIPGVRLQL
jgi:hypothetical protein